MCFSRKYESDGEKERERESWKRQKEGKQNYPPSFVRKLRLMYTKN